MQVPSSCALTGSGDRFGDDGDIEFANSANKIKQGDDMKISRTKALLTILATGALCWAGATNATTVVFDFDDLVDQTPVPSDYGGASWSGFIAAANFGGTSAPNIAYIAGTSATLDYAPGFTALTFSAGVFAPGTFSVYDGLGGLGTLLGSLTIDNPPADPFNFFLTGVSFSGIGRSVVVSGGSGAQIGWDDVTLTLVGVPEPASLALTLTALGFMVGLRMRRRGVVAAA